MTAVKDHSYYLAKDDYWNQRQFACPKIAAFYLQHRDDMQGHVTSLQLAEKLTVIEGVKRREKGYEEARMQDLDRLQRRKCARSVLEKACRPGSAVKVIPGPHSIQHVDMSLWERLGDLPVSQLKKFISSKQLDNDRREV